MNLAELSIRRPIFLTCIVISSMFLGYLALKKLPVDLFPDVNFPVVSVAVVYPSAGPQEVETQVSKPLEEQLSGIAGVKRITSRNSEGLSLTAVEFYLSTDIKYAEQQVRDKVALARPRLPDAVEEPIVRRYDPAAQPVVQIALTAKLPPAELYDLANEIIKPRLEQAPSVGAVELYGGRKREIQVEVNPEAARSRQISLSQVADMLKAGGDNVPAGSLNRGPEQTLLRTLGEYNSFSDIEQQVLRFQGNDVAVSVRQLARVKDTLADEKTRVWFNGEPTISLSVFRQSGTNTVAMASGVIKAIEKMKPELALMEGAPKLEVVRDGSRQIRSNINDMVESIIIGVSLTVVVVWLFLGNLRSTFITSLALPNSLLGAFLLMSMAGFTINIVTLLGLSLAVGLLVDDAIVVRENIFRRMQLGEKPGLASIIGTKEVQLAVIATTLVVLSVFVPISSLGGFTGQFFREFGLTICFAMVISLFDALTMAPMLSAYFFAPLDPHKQKNWWDRSFGRITDAFDRFQNWLEHHYGHLISWCVRRPWAVLLIAAVVFGGGLVAFSKVTKTYFPPQDSGEFLVKLELPIGSSLDRTEQAARQVLAKINANPEVEATLLTMGTFYGEANKASFYIRLVPFGSRKARSFEVKERIRQALAVPELAYAHPQAIDFDPTGGGRPRPFALNLQGFDQAKLEQHAAQVIAALKADKRLVEVDSNSRTGKPEVRFSVSSASASANGVSPGQVGKELAAYVNGLEAGLFRSQDREYQIRVRPPEGWRDLRAVHSQVWVPNLNARLLPLDQVAKVETTTGPATIERLNRSRYVQITADIAQGAGLGDVITDVEKRFAGDLKHPVGISHSYYGDSENFQEFGQEMALAILLAVVLMYLVLSSLYESFILPFAIMLALPLAVCGAFYALFLARESSNLFSMIGLIMLFGLASKNSILMVDRTLQNMRESGMNRAEALIEAGRTRLRPILMTTLALIAGTLPVAIGLNEASKQRTSMGVAIIGGLISSMLLTLVVVPAAFSYVDRLNNWVDRLFRRIRGEH